jgi:hypothetical protein
MEVGIREGLGEFKGLDLCHSLTGSGDRVSTLLILDALNKHPHLAPQPANLDGQVNILRYPKVSSPHSIHEVTPPRP